MENVERIEFIEKIQNVSRETFSDSILTRLDRYAEMLIEWNQKFNLVAASTLPHIWRRHFLDSAQLMRHIPASAQTLTDMGSGAGFPGLVLSIMGFPEVHLIEATGKKVNFLKAVIDELGLKAVLHQARAEGMKGLNTDVITARALSALPELFKLGSRFAKKDSLFLFPKGQNADSELTESKKHWTFQVEKAPSLSDDSGTILIINNLVFRHDALNKQRKKKR